MLREPQSTHPRVNLEMDGIRSGKRGGGLGEGRQQTDVTDNRCDTMLKNVGNLFREQRAQDQNRRLNAGLPQGDAFLQRDDGHAPCAVADQRLRGLDRAVSIGIRLDDCHDLTAGRKKPAELSQIMNEGRKVDGGTGW